MGGAAVQNANSIPIVLNNLSFRTLAPFPDRPRFAPHRWGKSFWQLIILPESWVNERYGLLTTVIIRLMNSVGKDNEAAEGNELPPSSPFEKPLPRWVQVPAGVVLALITLLCGFAVVPLLLMRYRYSPAPLLLVAVALFLLLGCGWILEKCLRLITGRKKRGGLLSPNALRVVAVVMLILPVVGLFTGYYRENRALAIFQVVAYFLGFVGLRALAGKREAEERSTDRRRH